MIAFPQWLKDLIARFKKTDLKTASARALAAVANEQEEVDAAARALAAKRAEALRNSTAALETLKTAKSEADAEEAKAEAARLETVENFDAKTTEEVEALEEALRNLKARRAGEKTTLETELDAERTEAADQAEAAVETEEEIAAAIAILRSGAAAQNGLNDGLKG